MTLTLNSDFMTDNIDNGREWLSPNEAASFAGVKPRTVYRWIERGAVRTNGEKGNLKIDRASLERLKQEQTAQRIVSQVIDSNDGQRSTPSENKNALAIQLMSLQNERKELMTQLNQAVEARGELRGQLSQVEKRIATLETDKHALQADLRRSNTFTYVLIAIVLILVTLAFVAVLLLK